MSENVKIKIAEVDNTKSASKGLGSSDIAFVPGFVGGSYKTAATDGSTPEFEDAFTFETGEDYRMKLCSTIPEFEAAFGKNPCSISAKDPYANLVLYGEATNNTTDGNDTFPDKSYLYARELISQGMPVVYCALPKGKIETIESTTVTYNNNNPQNFSDLEITSGDSYWQYADGKYSFKESVSDTTQTLQLKSKATDESALIISINTNSNNVDIGGDGINHISMVSDTANLYKFNLMLSKDGSITINSPTSNGLPAEITIQVSKVMSTSKTTTVETGSELSGIYGEGSKLSKALTFLQDRNEFSVKYITSGGYPSFYMKEDDSVDNTLANLMISCAKNRGDAVALIDYQLDMESDLYGDADSIYNKFEESFDDSFGTAMYPWGDYNVPSASVFNVSMPASFGYLQCVAKAIKTSPNWLAMAGVTRGLVPNLNALYTKQTLTNTIAENMQPKFGKASVPASGTTPAKPGNSVSVNCITNIRPYGLTIWGNRTLKKLDAEKSAVALNFLNTRNMVSDIKKLLYSTAKSLMFEQNSDTLWLRFKSGVSPLLNQLKTGNGISDYKIIKNTTKYNGDELVKGEISATVKIYPLYATEYFELTVEINDQDVTVSD